MTLVLDLISNPYLIAPIGSWLIAQVCKVVIYALVNRKIDFKRFFSDGGMPSGHSATVTALAVITFMLKGAVSFEFAVTLILAIIVCHDAMGVRRETGKQTVLLNEIVEAFEELTKEDLFEVKLKEFVGHTPIQVAAGIFLGTVNAIMTYNILV